MIINHPFFVPGALTNSLREMAMTSWRCARSSMNQTQGVPCAQHPSPLMTQYTPPSKKNHLSTGIPASLVPFQAAGAAEMCVAVSARRIQRNGF